jgi:iron complex outermembrane receptor protein
MFRSDRRVPWYLGFAVASALTFGPLSPLAAQETPAAEPAVADEEPLPGDSEEITVTARKREENLQEIPLAVSVVTGEALVDIGAVDISDVQNSVPNLSIYSGRNQSTTLTVFLRGIGQADPLWGVDPGVGLYFDDVYVARPQGALLDIFDVERIEVLRGPQGTLYGKNTIGGAIKYVSKALTDDLTGSLVLTGGDHDNRDVRASIAGALVPGKLRAKASFGSFQHDGYGTNLFTGRDVSDKDITAYRLGFDWLPSESVKVSLAYDETRDDSSPKGLTRLAANPFCVTFLGVACPPEGKIFDTHSGLAPLNGTDSQGAALTVRWTIDDAWQFKSISAHRESDTENNIDFDTTQARITDVITTYFDEQDSQEFQFLYDGGGSLAGVFGLYYFDGQAGGLVKNIFLNGLGGFGTTNGTTDTNSIAAFGDGSWAINDRATLNFGLRFTREEKNGKAFNAGYSNDTFTVVTSVLANYDKTETFDSIAPKLGIDYKFNADVMGYASVSRGFKSGGFNVRAQSNRFPESAEPFDDEVLDILEVGVKSVLLDRHLVLNTEAFYGKYKDIQVSTFTAFDSNGDGTDDAFFGNFLNAGNATLSGLEVEYDWSVAGVDWLGFSGNLAYLDADPDEFLDENRDGFVDTQVITNAPKMNGALRVNFDFPAFRGLINGSVGVAHRDDSVLTNEGGQYPGRPGVPLLPISQESFDLWDAWIGWLSPNATWRVSVAGKNLSDEEYLTNGYNIPALGILVGSNGQPRTITATIEYRFF